MGRLRKLTTHDAIDFSLFKQPSEHTAEFLKKQKEGLAIVALGVGIHADAPEARLPRRSARGRDTPSAWAFTVM